MAITDWPAQDRPREKLLKKGAASLTDAELLAIFLRTGVRNKSAVDLARELLNAFGSLRSLFDANIREFSQHHGLGTAKYTQLQAVLEMANRHLQETMNRNDVLNCPEITRRYLMSRLKTRQQEVFACLFLDNQNAVIHFEELFYGTIHSASVHPREIVKRCLHHNAAAVILAHNHPSGLAEPSQSDIRITERIKQALELVDTRLLDHMIIGDNIVVSLAERGLI